MSSCMPSEDDVWPRRIDVRVRTCNTCKWWELTDGTNLQGRCRCKSPGFGWPMTFAEDWCGDWGSKTS